jgi:hypothetical protein
MKILIERYTDFFLSSSKAAEILFRVLDFDYRKMLELIHVFFIFPYASIRSK